MSVTQAIAVAFSEAQIQYPQIASIWTQASHRWGGRLPHSLLMVNVQDAGRLDAVIRSMEDEFDVGDPAQHVVLSLLTMLSSQWISTGYEVLRVLKERNPLSSTDFLELEHDFRLVRVGLQKHEIALDKKLSGPVDMTRGRARRSFLVQLRPEG